MITKKHGLKIRKTDVLVGDPLYCLQVESKVSDYKQSFFNTNKYELVNLVNTSFLFNFSFKIFKISELKL